MLKWLLIILFLEIFIKEIDCKKVLRKYVLIRDEEFDEKGRSQYSILNANENEYLYRLKTSYTDEDQIILTNYPDENQIGYVQGQWTNEIVNVTFELFDFNENQWKNGTIIKMFHLFIEKYFIQWNNESFYLKKKLFSTDWKFSDGHGNEFARFRMRFRWFNWSLVKFNLKIFIDICPDWILFFAFIIQDHRAILL